MTTKAKTKTKAIRIVASSLCFDQEPPPVRSLTNARTAAVGIIDALIEAGMMIELDADDVAADGNGGTVDDSPADDATPLFPVQTAAGA